MLSLRLELSHESGASRSTHPTAPRWGEKLARSCCPLRKDSETDLRADALRQIDLSFVSSSRGSPRRPGPRLSSLSDGPSRHAEST